MKWKRGGWPRRAVPCLLLLAAQTVAGAPTASACLPDAVTALPIAAAPADELRTAFLALPADNSNDGRRAELLRRFAAAGCTGDHLRTEDARGSRHRNVYCELPGRAREVIVVAAHYDKSRAGEGALDNWSGVTLLPFLYRDLARESRYYTYRLIGFAGEERDKAGSRRYVAALDPEARKRLRAMVNLDTLGLHPARIDPRSAPALACALTEAAVALGIPIEPSKLGPPLQGDWMPFRTIGVPFLSVHALDPGDLALLHSPRDQRRRLDPELYFATYRLVTGFLQFHDPEALLATPEAASRSNAGTGP